MASYKIISENSTLGAPGTVITDEDIVAAPADIDLLVESGIVESVTKPSTKEKD